MRWAALTQAWQSHLRTRRQRRKAAVVVLGLVYLMNIPVIIVPTRGGTWFNVGSSRRVTTYGLFQYLETQRTTSGTPPVVGPLVVRVRPLGLALTLVALVIPALVLWFVARRWVRQNRIPGYCDECGYDLRVRTTDRCPECGEPVPAEATTGA